MDALRASRASKKPQPKPSSDARGKGAKKGVITSGRERVVASGRVITSGSGGQEQADIVEELTLALTLTLTLTLTLALTSTLTLTLTRRISSRS